MSEYQYYEFIAIDQPLTDKQIAAVRAYSTRAEITATRFVNEYHWGNFKGNVHDFLKRFFDAFVYVANWGTHRFAFRVPSGMVDVKAAEAYASDEILAIKSAGDIVIFDISSETEPRNWEEGSGWMVSLAPVREEVLAGDYRSLYLAWLTAVQAGGFNENELEPPVPAGLHALSAAQRALAEFIRLDDDLLTAAAEASLTTSVQSNGLAQWIAGLPVSEKNDVLTRLCDGSDQHVGVALRRRFQASRLRKGVSHGQSPRRVGTLLDRACGLTDSRRRIEAERRAQEKAHQEAEAAKARAEHLARLAARLPAAWKEVDSLIATKQPGNYERAVEMLLDLRDVAVQAGNMAKFADRLADMRTQHARKSSLIRQLVKAGLTAL